MLKRTDVFSLVELLVVIAILAILMSLLTPAMKRLMFDSEMLKCVMNLKGQGVAYNIYCDDSNDIYPGINSAGQVRANIYSNGGELGAQLGPYFSAGDKLGNNSYSNVESSFKCQIGRDYQNCSTVRYREGKVYYGLFFNDQSPYATSNNAAMRTDLQNSNLMHSIGDTWTMNLVQDRRSWGYQGDKGLQFKVLAMDGNKITRGWGSSEGIYTNHFRNPIDLRPATGWGSGFNPHQSRIGQAVVNYLFDDGSTRTEQFHYEDIFSTEGGGWNVRNPSGAGSDTWMVPKSYAVKQ